MENKEILAVIEENSPDVDIPDPRIVERALQKIRQYQAVVQKQLIAGVDYGTVPGTAGKGTLFKPGAEKLLRIHGLVDTYEVVEKIEDWDKGIFYYFIKCILRDYKTGRIVSEGLGSCNSKENKYRWRWVTEKELPQNVDKNALSKKTMNGQYGNFILYKLENDDIFSQVNTIQKMAKKRALLDAALSACRLSSIFTQDIDDEDIKNGISHPQPQPQPQSQPQIQPTSSEQEDKIDSKAMLEAKKLLTKVYGPKAGLEKLKGIKTQKELADLMQQAQKDKQKTKEETKAEPVEKEKEIPEEETIEEPF